jgi:hypothetical protein
MRLNSLFMIDLRGAMSKRFKKYLSNVCAGIDDLSIDADRWYLVGLMRSVNGEITHGSKCQMSFGFKWLG